MSSVVKCAAREKKSPIVKNTKNVSLMLWTTRYFKKQTLCLVWTLVSVIGCFVDMSVYVILGDVLVENDGSLSTS